MFKIRSRKPKPGKSLDPRICKAIKQKCVVVCVYIEGNDRRYIEPYCHGHSHAGEEILSAYQVEGPSKAGWKMFDVRKLICFEITKKKFKPHPDFNPIHPGVTQIHCQQTG